MKTTAQLDIPFNEVEIDSTLLQKMRQHQVEATKFLLDRLMGKQQHLLNGLPAKLSPEFVTGAILADEMGTGKTLVGISVIWSLCRHGRSKGIIVCPLTLVSNWEAEIKKWLGSTLGRTALFVSNSTGSGVKVKSITTQQLYHSP